MKAKSSASSGHPGHTPGLLGSAYGEYQLMEVSQAVRALCADTICGIEWQELRCLRPG